MRFYRYISLSFLSLRLASSYVSSGLPAHTHQKWLEQLTVDICQSPPGDMTPEMLHSTSQVMSAWAQNPYIHPKAPKMKDSHGVDCALAVEKLLKRIVDERLAGNEHANPTTDLYNAALQGWAMAASDKERGAAAQRAEQILMHMQAMYDAGDTLVQPNVESFYTVMMAWSWSREKFAAQRACQVLNWMINLSQAGANDHAVPDMECFTLVLDLVAKSGSKTAGKDTEEVFITMENFHKEGATTEHFNIVLDAWRRSGVPESAKRSEDILNYMELLTEAGIPNVKPDINTYNTVIQTLSKCRHKSSAKRATQMLKRLEKKYKNGDDSLEPDNIIFNIVLDKWAKSGEHDAALQAKKILERMSKLSALKESSKCAPDVYSYTSVISACAQTIGPKQIRFRSYQIARKAFDSLYNEQNDYVKPSHVTYGTMLKACANLLPKRDEFRMNQVRDIFSKCVQDGQVGDMVVSRLRQAACADYYHELLEGHHKANLPKDWTRNVREKRLQRAEV